MNEQFNEPLLSDPCIRKNVAYAAALSERMLPNYLMFGELVGFSSAASIRSIMDLVWEWIYIKNAKIDFEKQLAKLEAITPDPGEFDLYGVYPALNCCVALSTTIDLIGGGSEDMLDEVVQVSRDTINSFIEASGIDNGSSLLQEEANFKELVVHTLNSSDGVPVSLKELARNQGVSNLGISLV